MAVVHRIRCTRAPSMRNPREDDAGAASSVLLRCVVTVRYATQGLRGEGAAVRDRKSDPPWTCEDRRPVDDPSLLLRHDDTRRAVRDMLAAMPRIAALDDGGAVVSPENWFDAAGNPSSSSSYTPDVVARELHRFAVAENKQVRWLGAGAARYRFEVEMRLEVTKVFVEAVAVLRKCGEVAMQTVEPDSDEACAICMDEFRDSGASSSAPVNLPCSHAFHESCLLPWLHKGGTCPTCRHDLRGLVAAPWKPTWPSFGSRTC